VRIAACDTVVSMPTLVRSSNREVSMARGRDELREIDRRVVVVLSRMAMRV
jgi:hypothetical protein